MNPNRLYRAVALAVSLAALAAIFTVVSIIAPAPALAESASKTIALPAPDKTGGKPLMQALALRHSTRSFTEEAVSDQDLSNLLWAAWGINREDGRHTVPTAKNKQQVAVFAARADGVWRYDPVAHALVQYLGKDVRAAIGEAPLILLYAAPAEDPAAGFHIGSLYQNASLYCASADLGSVVKVSGADEADKLLALPDGYKIMIVQPVGHSKEIEK